MATSARRVQVNFDRTEPEDVDRIQADRSADLAHGTDLGGFHPHAPCMGWMVAPSGPGAPPRYSLWAHTRVCAGTRGHDISNMGIRRCHAADAGMHLLGNPCTLKERNPCIFLSTYFCVQTPPPRRLEPRRLVQHGSGISARQPHSSGGDAGPLAPTRRRHGRTGQGVRSACVRHAF